MWCVCCLCCADRVYAALRLSVAVCLSVLAALPALHAQLIDLVLFLLPRLLSRRIVVAPRRARHSCRLDARPAVFDYVHMRLAIALSAAPTPRSSLESRASQMALQNDADAPAGTASTLLTRLADHVR